MNKRTTTIALSILLLIAVVVGIRGLQDSSDRDHPAFIHGKNTSRPSHRQETLSGNNPDPSPSPRQRDNASERGVHDLAGAAPDRSFVTHFRGELNAGESLVMGGHPLPDGSHEFTFMTPTQVKLEDGTETIRLQTKTFAISPESVQQGGMESFTKRGDNPEPYAEAWTQEDLDATLHSFQGAQATQSLTAPSIQVIPGQSGIINLCGADGEPRYTLETTIDHNGKGGFAIESRVTHVWRD